MQSKIELWWMMGMDQKNNDLEVRSCETSLDPATKWLSHRELTSSQTTKQITCTRIL